jgi:hypothetical protein
LLLGSFLLFFSSKTGIKAVSFLREALSLPNIQNSVFLMCKIYDGEIAASSTKTAGKTG